MLLGEWWGLPMLGHWLLMLRPFLREMELSTADTPFIAKKNIRDGASLADALSKTKAKHVFGSSLVSARSTGCGARSTTPGRKTHQPREQAQTARGLKSTSQGSKIHPSREVKSTSQGSKIRKPREQDPLTKAARSTTPGSKIRRPRNKIQQPGRKRTRFASRGARSANREARPTTPESKIHQAGWQDHLPGVKDPFTSSTILGWDISGYRIDVVSHLKKSKDPPPQGQTFPTK